jgi:hypothetical protein
MTGQEIYEQTSEGSEYLTVVIALDLHEIACASTDGSLDGLNELADREIGTSLTDLTFKPLGVDFDHTGKSTGKIFIECRGNPEMAIEEHEETQRRDEKNGLFAEHVDPAN